MHANASISGILLAAGLGSRLGGGKLLLQYKGKPLLAHSLAAVLSAGGLARLILVLGNDAAPLTKALNACLNCLKRANARNRPYSKRPWSCCANPVTAARLSSRKLPQAIACRSA